MLNQKGSKTSSKLFGFVNSRHFSKNEDVQYNRSSGLKILVGLVFKVHIFWEGHKILRNLYLTFDCMYCRQKFLLFSLLFKMAWKLKFIYSEKATKFCKISTLLLTGTT